MYQMKIFESFNGKNENDKESLMNTFVDAKLAVSFPKVSLKIQKSEKNIHKVKRNTFKSAKVGFHR